MVTIAPHLPETGRLDQGHLTAWLAGLVKHRSREEIHRITLALQLVEEVDEPLLHSAPDGFVAVNLLHQLKR